MQRKFRFLWSTYVHFKMFWRTKKKKDNSFKTLSVGSWLFFSPHLQQHRLFLFIFIFKLSF